MLILYGDPMSRAHRVMWTLRELRLDYTHFPTDLLRGGNKTPAFLTVNPNGKLSAQRDLLRRPPDERD